MDSARALLYEKERVREVRKSFAATVSLAENFPRKTKELLALIRLLLPNNGSVAYWGAVLEEKVPQGSFPLKLGLPPLALLIHFLKLFRNPPVCHSVGKYCCGALQRGEGRGGAV